VSRSPSVAFPVELFWQSEKENDAPKNFIGHGEDISQDITRVALAGSTDLKVGRKPVAARRTGHKHPADVLREPQLLSAFGTCLYGVIFHTSMGKTILLGLEKRHHRLIHALGDTESGHYTEAKWFDVPFPVVLTVCFFLIGKLDLFRDQSLLVLVAFKLDGFTNL
jgi:hypothetical protein